MTYTSFDSVWWPFVFILLAGSLPTMIWRWLGVYLAGDLDETSEWISLVRCISAALIAAVVAQFIVQPSGSLADIPLLLRVGAAAFGFIVFLRTESVFAAVLSGEALLIVGAFAASGLQS